MAGFMQVVRQVAVLSAVSCAHHAWRPSRSAIAVLQSDDPAVRGTALLVWVDRGEVMIAPDHAMSVVIRRLCIADEHAEAHLEGEFSCVRRERRGAVLTGFAFRSDTALCQDEAVHFGNTQLVMKIPDDAPNDGRGCYLSNGTVEILGPGGAAVEYWVGDRTMMRGHHD